MSGDHSSGSGEDRTGLALLGILLALVIFISAMAHRPAGGSGPVCGNPGLVGERRKWQFEVFNIALSNSFGFGGTNAALLFKRVS